jgi:hypothetical protein
MTPALVVRTDGEEMMDLFLRSRTVRTVLALDFAETVQMSIEGGMTSAKYNI